MILYVEDDEDDIALTRLGLARAGIDAELAIAGDGQEALDLLGAAYAAGRPAPELIVSDIKMPRVDGLEFLRRVKQDLRLKSIPVIILSSSGDAGDRAEALRQGAAAYLRKPEDLDGYYTVAAEIRLITGAGARRARRA